MEYEELVYEFSENTGINIKLFNLDNVVNKAKKDGLVLLERQDSNNQFYSTYEYWENTNENWKSLVLYIPKEILPQLLFLLNPILEIHKQELIDLKNIQNFHYLTRDNGFNVLLGTDSGDYFRLEFAKKNYINQ